MNAEFTDREMWIAIRAALLGIAKAIETYNEGNMLAVAIRAGLLAITDAIERRYALQKHKLH